MSRAQRRASVADFKRACGRRLSGHLPAPGRRADQHPVAQARRRVLAGLDTGRKPKCIACRAEFSADARVGAYLCTIPSGAPSTATVSGLCADCWRDLSDEAVKALALRVIRRVMPTATFDPEPPR